MANITGKLRQAKKVITSRGVYLVGEIHGDTRGRFKDGLVITTSRVLSQEGAIFHTIFSIYEVESWAEVAP